MAVTGAAPNAGQLKLDYLNLLVAQLQNQNPLEPMDNNEMTAQMAAISQLEQLEAMNTTFASVLEATEGRYASGLIGREITFLPEDGDAALIGQVTGVERWDGAFHLRVGDRVVALEQVQGIAL